MRTRRKDLKATMENFGPEQVKGYEEVSTTISPTTTPTESLSIEKIDILEGITPANPEEQLEEDYPVEESIIPVASTEPEVIVETKSKVGKGKKSRKSSKKSKKSNLTKEL